MQVGRHEVGGGDGRLDLVYPQLDVVAVRFGLPPVERHVVGRGLPHCLERLVGQAPLQEAGLLHELRGEVGAVEVLHDARELSVEAAPAHVAQAEHHRAAQRHDCLLYTSLPPWMPKNHMTLFRSRYRSPLPSVAVASGKSALTPSKNSCSMQLEACLLYTSRCV